MDPDDDMIRRALGAGRAEADPPASALDRAITSGVRRRRGVVLLSCAASMAVVAVIAAGVLELGRGADDEIVGVAPTPTTTPIATTSSATSPATSPPTSPPISLPASPTTPDVSTPPFVFQPTDPTPSLPMRSSLQVGSRSVTVAVEAAAPPVDDALAVAGQGDVTQLWSVPVEAGSVPELVASVSADGCPVVGCVSLAAYDGRYVWIVLDTVGADDAVTALQPAELLRADLATGAIELVGMPDLSTERTLLDVVPSGPAGAVVVAESDGALRIRQIDAALLVTVDSAVPVTAGGVLSARIDPVGRRLAYSWAVPPEGTSTVRVVDLATGVEREVGDRPSVYPLVLDWSADGARLLIGDRWEDWFDYELQIADGSRFSMYADACYLGDRLAVGRWLRAYAESPDEPGALEVVGRDGAVLERRSAPIIGAGLVCTGNGSVATFASVPGEDGTFGPAIGLVIRPDLTVAPLPDGLAPLALRLPAGD